MNRFSLTPQQREQIQAIYQHLVPNQAAPLRRRALAVLLYDQGKPTYEVAAQAGLSRSRARYWRRQFIARGMSIFYAMDNQTPSGLSTRAPAGSTEGANQAAPESSPEPGPSPEAGAPLLENVFENALARNPKALTFPKRMDFAGISAEDSLAEAGRKTMLFHFAEMLGHEEGTRLGEDAEELHDMRVATRRMRAAFDIFGEAFRRKALQPHLKGLRAAGRALGRVRDLDVFIEKAGHYLESLPPEQRSGLDPLVHQWEQERQAAREEMLTHLDSPAYREFKQKFNLFVQTPGKGVRKGESGSPSPDRVREVAPVLVYTRLASVRAYETILNNATLEQLHALRIEFKKLRYAVEFFREVFGQESKPVINALKTVQDHLGDLNDARVACQLLSDFLVNWENRQASSPLAERQNPQPIAAYLAAKHAECHHLMVTFPKTWASFNSPEFRRNLALAVAGL